MRYKPYMKNGKKISVLGFGAWPLGNTSRGVTMTEEDGIKLVHEAIENGVNFFDTAPNYALGKSETILGKALVGKRDQVVINTKFGHHSDDTIDFDANKIRTSVIGSLKRLNTDYLDSVILHNPSHDILAGETEHFKILKQLKEEGIIRGFGVSIDTLDELKLTLKHLDVDVIELLYNVFSQSTRAYLDDIAAKNIALIIKVPLDSGWLTGKYAKHQVFTDIRSRWTEYDKARRDQLVKGLKDIIKTNEITPYALGFLWSYDAITTVIPGIRTIEQLKEHVQAESFDFPRELKEVFEHYYDEFIKEEPLPW